MPTLWLLNTIVKKAIKAGAKKDVALPAKAYNPKASVILESVA